ncbi:MAG: hypothetical protein P8129_19415 [Anaerolineae bacterium]
MLNVRRSKWWLGLAVLALVLVVLSSGPGLAAQGGDGPGAGQQWLSFGSGTVGQLPALALVGADGAALELAADLPGCLVEEVETEAGTFSRLYGEGYGHAAKFGLPALPVLRREVEIPFGAALSLEVVAAEYGEHSLAELGLHAL